MTTNHTIPAALLIVLAWAGGLVPPASADQGPTPPAARPVVGELRSEGVAARIVAAALERTRHRVVYDGSYRRIAYPNGDVPATIGVCTDVVIRSLRAVGIDLQREVHEDMRRAFDAYPRLWGLSRPDRNIDHRRVPNLQRFFERRGAAVPVSRRGDDYLPGDLVTWMLPGNLPHIGIVVDGRSGDGERPLIVHNIGSGPELADTLFVFPVTGHYRYPRRE
jgi:uncharacterized protein YijF (DUF1287 family)